MGFNLSWRELQVYFEMLLSTYGSNTLDDKRIAAQFIKVWTMFRSIKPYIVASNCVYIYSYCSKYLAIQGLGSSVHR